MAIENTANEILQLIILEKFYVCTLCTNQVLALCYSVGKSIFWTIYQDFILILIYLFPQNLLLSPKLLQN